MRDYELVIIITPEFEKTAILELVDKIKGWITDSGGTIKTQEDWGRKKFAYLIRNHKEGQYLRFELELDPSAVADLERNFRLQESILRYLITVQEE
jgi:small subunit ribosomal protein S6